MNNMELEVGMYVRLSEEVRCNEYPIIKIINIDYNDNFEFCRRRPSIKFDKADFTYLDELKDMIKYGDAKASHNIIDLIEEGDYINDIKVKRILNRDNNYLYIYPLGLDEIMLELTNTDIKSIVTKEQFESMSYKL